MKIRVEITCDDGTKNAVEYEGDIKNWKDKLIRYLSEELNIGDELPFPYSSTARMAFDYSILPQDNADRDTMTLKERLQSFLLFDQQPMEWLTSQEVKKRYERAYKTRINLSTVSTYMSRMYRDDILERRGNRRQREYRVSTEVASKIKADPELELRGVPEQIQDF